MRREDRSSIRLILSQTSAGKEWLATSSMSPCSRCSFVRAWRPFLRPGLRVRTRRTPGAVKAGRRIRLAAAPALPGHALTGPSTARCLRRSGRHCIGLDALEGAPVVENRPGDAGELVGQRNGEHVVVETLLRCLDP